MMMSLQDVEKRFEVEKTKKGRRQPKKMKLEHFEPTAMDAGENVVMTKEDDGQDCDVGEGVDFPRKEEVKVKARKGVMAKKVMKKTVSKRCISHVCPEPHCDKTFNRRFSLTIHHRKAHGNEGRSFKCIEPGCAASYCTVSSLRQHLSAVHKKSQKASTPNLAALPQLKQPPNTCSVRECGATFDDLHSLSNHMRTAHNKQFLCPEEDCGAFFTRKENMDYHIAGSHRNERLSCPKENCDLTFSGRGTLRKHILTKHNSSMEKHMCPVHGCGKKFNLKSSLNQHSRNSHKINYPSQSKFPQLHHCPGESCDAEFTRKDQLYRHLRVEHVKRECAATVPTSDNPALKQKPESPAPALPAGVCCPLAGCEMNFAYANQLSRHVKAVHGQVPCPVLGCGFMSGSYGKLAKHNDVAHENKRLMCPEENCNAMYAHKQNLTMHIRMQHRPLQRLVCPRQDCGATFKWKASLQHHVKAKHAPVDQQLNVESSLSKHTIVHHIRRKYACPHQGCGWSFELRPSLKKHMKAKHGLVGFQNPTQDQTISSSAAGSDAKTQEIPFISHPPKATECSEEDPGKQVIKEVKLKSQLPAVASETPRGPLQCNVPGCGYTCKDHERIVLHLNQRHPEDPCKTSFTDQATGATLVLFDICKFVMQCKVCMKVRTARDNISHLTSNIKTHIAAFHPEELEATNGCAAPLYRVLQDCTGRKCD